MPSYGWVPFDTGLGDTKDRPLFARHNDHFVFHTSGGRSSLLGSNYTSRVKAADTTTVARSAEWTVRAITLERPPAVTTGDAEEVAGSSARLNGNLTAMGSAASVAVSFQYGTAPGAYSGETVPDVKTAAWAFSASLDGLSPGVTYYYRATAAGHGAVYGQEKSFTAGTTPPAVTTGDVTNVTTNSVWLNGDLMSMGTSSSVAVSFAWGTTARSYPNETASQAMTGTGVFHCSLDSLTPGTTYYYRAMAAGDGAGYGVEKSFTTLPRPRVQNLHPCDGERNQHLTVAISGSNLDGATSVDFGPGIAVEDFSVYGSTEITVRIAIDADAAKGARDVSVTTPMGVATLTDAFTVGVRSSGVAPVWVWPMAGVVLVAAGVGGFFLFRGGELSPSRLRLD